MRCPDPVEGNEHSLSTCSRQGGSFVTEEHRRYEQQYQDLVYKNSWLEGVIKRAKEIMKPVY